MAGSKRGITSKVKLGYAMMMPWSLGMHLYVIMQPRDGNALVCGSSVVSCDAEVLHDA